jgi:hypothetical protein
MQRQNHVRLLALLGVFTLLGLTYSLVTPLFEAPDEVWHYAYVRYLAEERALPALTDAENAAYQEVAQPPLYYAVAALVSGGVRDDDLDALMWHNPGFGYQAGGTVNDNKNMLVHTGRERFPWRGAVLALRLARFVSLAFGLLAVLAAWGLGREAFPRSPGLALCVAATVAFAPQFLFISSVASNDSTAAALSTAALWASARIANHGPTVRRSLVAGLLIGLAALSKTSCLLLMPLALVVLFCASRRVSESANQRVSKSVNQQVCKTSASSVEPSASHHSPFAIRRLSLFIVHWSLVILTASAVGGWWYLRNAFLYGDPFGLRVHANTPWGRAAPASLTTLLTELPALYRSFWGGFGWGHVEYPAWIYLALGALVVASLAGWLWTLKTRRLPGRRRIFVLAAVWCALVFAALLAWMRQIQAPHGRLLFPALGAWAVLLVGGWNALSRITFHASRFAHHVLRIACPVPLICLALLSLATPFLVIHPAFAPPRLLPPAEAAATVGDAGFTYGDVARLLGVALDRPSVAPGGVLAVRACWEALAPLDWNYTVFVHLVGRDGARVAERHTYPGLGRFPTSLWPVGRAFCDVYRLRVEEWAPAPELYDLEIGLYDLPSGERLIARDSAGAAVEFPTPTQVRVAPERPLDISPQHPLDYRLGGEIALIGTDLSGPLQAGAPLTVTLYWRAEAPPQENYAVFVHLLDESGQQVAQHDGLPRYGRYPTPAWHAGDVVPDEHVLDLPSSLPAGRLHLAVGMYCPETLERLPVVGPAGPLPDGLISLPLESP